MRFIKIDSGTKRPIEKNWAQDNCYRYNESEIKKYLKTAKSYGVVCGYGNLIIVDIEDMEDKSLFNLVALAKFPPTFMVRTGGGGWHLYYFCSGINKRIVLTKTDEETKEEKHYGEIQSKGNQCIGPGSKHPSGNTYKITNPQAISTIDKKTLLAIVADFIKDEDEYDTSNFKINSVSEGLDWDISELIKHCNLETKDDINYRGPHPVHGSENGRNFDINVEKNTWYCHRCHVGGDAVNLVAMLGGLTGKSDVCPSKEKFRKVFKKAKKLGIKKYGFPDDGYEPSEIEKKPQGKLQLYLWAEDGKKLGLNTRGIVEYLNRMHKIISIADATGRGSHIYVYKDGYYRLDGEGILKTEIKDLFEHDVWTKHKETEIITFISSYNTVHRDDLKASSNLINLKNGVYDIEKKTFVKRGTQKFDKYYSDNYFLYIIPWDYKPNAKLTTKIEKYFKTTFMGKQKYIDFTQELFGYCLYSKYNYHGLFYLYGTGGNGKTVWISLLESLLGKANVTNKSVNSLIRNRFTTSSLYGKLLNSCGELSGFVLQDTDMLKRLTAGDRIEAEFKNKDGFDFENVAKIITACNAIPASQDKTDGWCDRQFILPFLVKFRYSKKQDADLKEKLITQQGMEGLLVWAIDGLQRLLDNKGFTYTKNREDTYYKYQKNVKYFVEKHYQSSTNIKDYIRMHEVQDEYETWCRKNDIPIDSYESLSRVFRYFKFPDSVRIRENGKRIHVRYGMQKVN